jgi:hypothetical protein
MGKDKLLFTPGPLTTSETVKQAMMRDPGAASVRKMPVAQVANIVGPTLEQMSFRAQRGISLCTEADRSSRRAKAR